MSVSKEDVAHRRENNDEFSNNEEIAPKRPRLSSQNSHSSAKNLAIGQDIDSLHSESLNQEQIASVDEQSSQLTTDYSENNGVQNVNNQNEEDSDSSIEVLDQRAIDDSEGDFNLNNAFSGNASNHIRDDESIDSPEQDNSEESSDQIQNEEITNLNTQNNDNAVNDSNIQVNGGSEQNDENSSSSTNIENEAIELSSSQVISPPTIDLEATEQRVVEIPDEQLEKDIETKPASEYKAARNYQCPICFDAPDTALITACGHVFCCDCLFHMVNSSRTNRGSGHCALCRTNVRFRDVRLVILRKKRIRRES